MKIPINPYFYVFFKLDPLMHSLMILSKVYIFIFGEISYMSNRNKKLRSEIARMICDYLQRSGNTIKYLAYKSGVSKTTIKRAIDQETTLSSDSVRAILDSIELTLYEIESFMAQYYSHFSFPKDHDDIEVNREAAEHFARDEDTAILWGLTGKIDGTSETEVRKYVAGDVARPLLNEFYETGHITEQNNKITSKDIGVGGRISLKMLFSIVRVAMKQQLCPGNRVKSFVMAGGISSEGQSELKQLETYNKQKCREIYKKHRGNHVCFFGMCHIDLENDYN